MEKIHQAVFVGNQYQIKFAGKLFSKTFIKTIIDNSGIKVTECWLEGIGEIYDLTNKNKLPFNFRTINFYQGPNSIFDPSQPEKCLVAFRYNLKFCQAETLENFIREWAGNYRQIIDFLAEKIIAEIKLDECNPIINQIEIPILNLDELKKKNLIAKSPGQFSLEID